MMRTIHLADAPSLPWRNGGGVTQELCSWPSLGDWQFRISVARIESNGPFSSYPGIDRWFAVVDGLGVRLRFPSSADALEVGREPLCFDGANAPDCQLIAGATSDLNLMVRRDAGTGHMQEVRAEEYWQSAAVHRALFTMDAVSFQVDGGAPEALRPGTLVIAEHAANQSWRCAPASTTLRAWWLSFAPRS